MRTNDRSVLVGDIRAIHRGNMRDSNSRNARTPKRKGVNMAIAIAISGLILSGIVMAFCKFSQWAERAERNMMRHAQNGPVKMWCTECHELVDVEARHGPYVTTLDCSQCGDEIDLIIHPN